ncbi:peptidylprolyl isomerase fpr3, partial [Massospora cicadina]
KALAKQQREQASQSEDKKDAQKRKAEETPSENKKAKTEGAQTQQNQEGGNKSTPQKGAKTHSNGLIVEDITVGTGKEAKNNDTIQMRYVGKLSTGKVFDKNTSGEPFTFHLGKGEVIKGWDQGILGMKVGGERRLTIPAHLAYGKRGSPPAIPPKATLLFEVKLLNIK